MRDNYRIEYLPGFWPACFEGDWLISRRDGSFWWPIASRSSRESAEYTVARYLAEDARKPSRFRQWLNFWKNLKGK